MKKVFSSICFFCLIATTFAQKKITPVSQSLLTGISLPAGSKQDKRMLSLAAAKMLLQIESEKAKTSLAATEVLVLPPVTGDGFNADSLIKNLTVLGWAITIVEGNDKYAWLQKDKRHLIMYFLMGAKETELYFAEATAAPLYKTPENITATIPATPAATNEHQQTTGTIIKTDPPEIIQKPPTPFTNSGFAFTTTNFDDGWTSTVQEDWVETTKGNIKVLIHYPNKNADAYNSVLMDGLKNAWNVLVAPRYSSAINFEFKPITGWQSIEFAEADMVEKNTGNTVHVVVFKMNYSNGNGKYLEFITPDKQSFENEFGAYHQKTYGWEKMEKMANYNKFAVAASDLTGKWTNDFSGAIQYVSASTGFDSHMATHASVENFLITAAYTYNWDLGVASGNVGNIKFQSVKSNGKLSMTGNWKLNFSDIGGKARTYNVYFSCIKGLRILWLDERAFAKADQ